MNTKFVVNQALLNDDCMQVALCVLTCGPAACRQSSFILVLHDNHALSRLLFQGGPCTLLGGGESRYHVTYVLYNSTWPIFCPHAFICRDTKHVQQTCIFSRIDRHTHTQLLITTNIISTLRLLYCGTPCQTDIALLPSLELFRKGQMQLKRYT